MKKDVDKEEVKKCLKDANVYEENMSDDLMAEYYKAIKNSETSLREEAQKDVVMVEEAEKSLNESANELLEAINNSESVAPSKRVRYTSKSDDEDCLDAFSQVISQKTNSKMPHEETNNNNNNNIHIDGKLEKAQETSVILDIKRAPFGFNDMPKSQNIDPDMLKIISHELKFINIQNSKRYLTGNSESRIKMLYNYHVAAAKLRAHYASLSNNMAPIGKPITAIDHDLCVNPVISSLKEEEVQISSETTYISRSGRLTKRKVYNEFDESSLDSFGTSKRTRNDDDWLSKNSPKEKTSKLSSKKHEPEEGSSNNNCGVDKTISKPRTKIKRSDSPDSSQDIALTAFKDQFDEVKDSTPVQSKPRTYERKAPSNIEIMMRSSLFKDTNSTKKGRTGAILDAAREETVKKNQHEEVITKFTNSLDLDSQTLDDESEKIIVDDEDVFERRRVVPPVPTSRKPIHGRKRGGGTGPEPLNISAKKANPSASTPEAKSSAVNGVTRRTPLPRRVSNNNNADKPEPSSSSSSKGGKKEINMTPCPLCSMSFPEKEIEEHAATCGEDMFPQNPQPRRITCEVCDAVVPFSTDYEVHVKACIAKRNSGGLV